MYREVLPGSILTYGRATWQNKAIALVWAVFLIVDFALDRLHFFLQQGAVHHYRLWGGDSDHGL